MRSLAFGCVVAGSFLLLWALSNLLGWWFVPSWHANREPIISAFFLLFPATLCTLLAAALTVVNRRRWPRHMLFGLVFILVLGIVVVILFWLTNAAPT
jgi:hypothetical protein